MTTDTTVWPALQCIFFGIVQLLVDWARFDCNLSPIDISVTHNINSSVHWFCNSMSIDGSSTFTNSDFPYFSVGAGLLTYDP